MTTGLGEKAHVPTDSASEECLTRWCSRFPHAEDDLLLFLVLEISREARYILFLPCSHGFTRAVPEREETTAAALAGEAGWGERQR